MPRLRPQTPAPALLLLEPDGTVWSAHVQSTPFARPHLRNLLDAVGWVGRTSTRPAARPEAGRLASGR